LDELSLLGRVVFGDITKLKEALVHANARLTVHARRLVVERRLGGVGLGVIAEQLGVSRQTVSKWWNRYLEDPDGDWFLDQASVPNSTPHRIPQALEDDIVAARRDDRAAPFQLAHRFGVSRATIHRVLVDHGMNRIGYLDMPRKDIVRYERATPGDLVHIDTKKFGRIPEGGGRFSLGDAGYRNAERVKQRIGYIQFHAAVDDHSRMAYGAMFNDASGSSCAEFLIDTISFFATYGIRINQIMTDNAKAYGANVFAATRTDHSIDHIRTRPYRPQTNGKVERFFRTAKAEWAYASKYHNETERATALDTWLNTYNTQRAHSAIGAPPITRVNNAPE
jgi:transposase InsO family protein